MQNKSSTHKDFSIKARKRQFDSRWRANIASCFETLLQIIPINKRAIKKQSKAQILESTIHHLEFLKKTYVYLLHEKARRLEVSSEYSWCSERFREMEEQFIKKQLSKPRKPIQSVNKIKKYQVIPVAVNSSPILRMNKELVKLKEANMEIFTSQASEELRCDESDDETVQCSVSLENTPQNTGDLPSVINIEPIKRKVKTIPSWPLKCRRSLIKKEEFLKKASNLAERINDAGLKPCLNGSDIKTEDERIGDSDPWLVSDAFQRILSSSQVTTIPPSIFSTVPFDIPPPSNDFLPLMGEFDDEGGEYAGRNSPLFPMDLAERALSGPPTSAFDDSAWTSSFQ